MAPLKKNKEEFGHMGTELILAQVREEEDLIRVCKEADGLINQYAWLTRRVFDNLPKCKVVARYGVGVDSIDLRAATDLGIIVANVPDYCIDEVSDHTIAMILSLIRKTVFFNQKVKSDQWDFQFRDPHPSNQGKNFRSHRMRKNRLGSGKKNVHFWRSGNRL